MSKRKTYKLKGSAKASAGGKGVYKVKGGWRIARRKRKRRK